MVAAALVGGYFVQTAYSAGPPDLVIAGLTVDHTRGDLYRILGGPDGDGPTGDGADDVLRGE